MTISRPKAFVIALTLTALGFAAWLVLARDDPRRAYAALLAGFSFFLPIMAGLITWSAVVQVSHGQWMGSLERTALSGLGFAIPSLALLMILWVGGRYWAPWYADSFSQAAWFMPGFVFGRTFFILALFWILCAWYASRRLKSEGRLSGAWLILAYCMAMSLYGFDFILGLVPPWPNAVFGVYFFVSGMYGAATVWALVAAVSSADVHQRHDLGKLVYAFCMLTAYLMFAQLLTIWYENLPSETTALVLRFNLLPWSGVSLALLAVIYIGPIGYLLPRRCKRSRPLLGGFSVLILAGLWVERMWLVLPSMGYSNAAPGDFAVLVLLAGIACLGSLLALRRLPSSSFPTPRFEDE